ncbi:MAG: ferrous iron transport protein A [Bacteroidia bacterium]|nr:ferrous iron transport protein A [Bacteroidia bacterium]
MITSADRLKIGQNGKISTIKKHDLALKLMEMNCLPGEIISLERVAPFGDPLIFKVSGYFLGLRKCEADCIEVDL